MKFWKRLKPWWKGAIIGGMISLLPIPLFFMGLYLGMKGLDYLALIIINIGWLPTTIPTALFTGKILASHYSGEEGMAFFVLFPLSTILDTIIGAIIGLITSKIKKVN